jgi:hypothetical protein
MPNEGPMPPAYRALGMDVTFTVWPGYIGMMAEPHEAVLAPSTLASITEWLSAAHPVAEEKMGGPATAGAGDPLALDGLRESPVHFGPDGALFGILAEPDGGSALPARADTAVLLLNVGGNYRIGPNRVYVKASRELAAAGYRTFRFDVAGIGDSRVDAGFTSASMYRSDSIADVAAAIDMLAGRGCKRFYLMGICSGSYLAFETALADPRVTGQVLLNSRLLEWDASKSGHWQSSMQEYYKSTRFYRQALLRTEMYGRLLRGKVNVRGIARRLWTLASARIQRAWVRLLHRGPPEAGVLAKFKHLSARGTDTLLIMSAEDDGLDYVEFHLGSRGALMQGQRGFRMVLIENADHTFSGVSGQRAMIAAVRDHLDQQHGVSPAPQRVAGSMATT